MRRTKLVCTQSIGGAGSRLGAFLNHREWPMNLKRSYLFWILPIVAAALLLPCLGAAQEAREGINSGNYNVKQAFEFGYRFTDFTGSQAVFGSFVNFNDGPRLLEHTLEMRSLNHQGWLFDNFYLTSMGYGGDPNNFSRLRMYKNKWYNFNANFRLDRNRWDYNLLANPLNPTTSSPFVPVTDSPHRFDTVRRMGDYNLTLFPQSRVRLRMGYARSIHEGPSVYTVRAGTEAVAFQGWKTTLNSYTMGLDFKFIPKTNVSYDQFLHYYKGDTTWAITDFPYQLSNGTPVNLGLPFNTVAGQPCARPLTSTTTTPPTADATCNSFILYNMSGNVRTTYPTEQLSFQSNYFKNLDLAGRFAYSSSDHAIPSFRENFDGRYVRLNGRANCRGAH